MHLNILKTIMTLFNACKFDNYACMYVNVYNIIKQNFLLFTKHI